MKKAFSLLITLMILALPLAGTAESMAAGSFFQKYLEEGQRQVVDFSLQLGDGAQSMLGDETGSMVQELLNAMKIELAAQKGENKAQGALRILMNDQLAADVVLAVGEKGLYGASSFLGDKILMLTPEQVKNLAEQVLQQMVDEGQLTQEQLDQLKGAAASFSGDPEAFLSSLIGSPDLQGLMEAFQGVVSQNPEITAVEEVPEGVTIDAKMRMSLVLSKEGMTRVTTELAKVLYSMPVIRKSLTFAAQQNGQEAPSEEQLITALNRIPEVLEGDLPLDLYMNETGDQMQFLSDFQVKSGETTTPVSANVLIEMAEAAPHLAGTIMVGTEDTSATVFRGDMRLTGADGGQVMDMDISTDITENGETYTALQENIHMTFASGENDINVNADVTVQVKQDASSDPVTVSYTASFGQKDLGDHAESNTMVTFAIDGLGTILTVTADGRTDMAEAWITVDEAVQPLSMSPEEQEILMGEIQQSAFSGMIMLLNSLPSSVQSLILQNADALTGQ